MCKSKNKRKLPESVAKEMIEKYNCLKIIDDPHEAHLLHIRAINRELQRLLEPNNDDVVEVTMKIGEIES